MGPRSCAEPGPPPVVGGGCSGWIRDHRTRARAWATAIGALVLAATCVSSSASRDRSGSAARGHDNVRGPRLLLHRRDAAEIVRLGDGAPARAGDVVQLSYAAAGNHHGVIVSLDGAGTVTLHHPPDPDDSTHLRPRGEVPLGHAYELDDARDFERFFFVTSGDRPVNVRHVLLATRRLAGRGDARRRSLDLPGGLGQTSLTLRKKP